MADKKISDLLQNPSLTGTEELATERGGSNYKNTYEQLKVWLQSVLVFMTPSIYDPQSIEGDAFDRSNHTSTQEASTISDFDTEVSNNTDVAANNARGA